MSSTDYILNLYEYNEWANNLVLNAASGLSEEQLRLERGASFGSMVENLRHIVQAQHGWLSFWTDTEWRRLPELAPGGSMETLQTWFRESHAKLAQFVVSLGAEDVKRVLTDTDESGQPLEMVQWQMMAHVVNHGTQHRAETGALLAALGSSPGDLDYGHFCDIRASESPGTPEMIRTLYDYNQWANQKLLDTLAGLSDEELMRPRGVSHSSLGMDLLHLVAAQVGWLSIWQGGAPRIPLPSAQSGRFLDSLVDWYARSHEAIHEFIASLREQDLGRPRIDNPHGGNPSVKQNRSMLLWDMMMHVVNHGTQHRSEAAMALTALGRSPGDLDFIDFVGLRQEHSGT